VARKNAGNAVRKVLEAKVRRQRGRKKLADKEKGQQQGLSGLIKGKVKGGRSGSEN
jgi:hypothetical protein